VVLIVSAHVTAAHGPLVLVYKTACVVRFSFTYITNGHLLFVMGALIL